MIGHDLNNLQAAIPYIDTLGDNLFDQLEAEMLTASVDKVEKRLRKMAGIITGFPGMEQMPRRKIA